MKYLKVQTTGMNFVTDKIFRISIVDDFGKMHDFWIDVDPNLILASKAFSNTQKTDFITKLNQYGRPLQDHYQEIGNLMAGEVTGWNISSFDIPFMVTEFAKHKLVLDITSTEVNDLLVAERNHYKINLTDALKRFGIDFVYSDEFNDNNVYLGHIKELHKLMSESGYGFFQEKIASTQGLAKFNEDGDLVLAVGKYEGRKVVDICNEDKEYMSWLWGKADYILRINIKKLCVKKINV